MKNIKRTAVALTAAVSATVGLASSATAQSSIPQFDTAIIEEQVTSLQNMIQSQLPTVQDIQNLIPIPAGSSIPGISPNAPAPAPAPPRGDCSPQAFNDAEWQWRDSNRTVVEYCDGRFAWVSQNQTDWRLAFEFDGQQWRVSQPAGTTKTGMLQDCYNGIELRNKGASPAFLSWLPICTPDEIGYRPW